MPLVDPGTTLGHPLRPKPPRSTWLCASVIKYLCQAALKQNYSCVSVTPPPPLPKGQRPSLGHLSPTPPLDQYFVQSCIPTSASCRYPYHPNLLSKGAPRGHGARPDVLAPVPSSTQASLGLCVQVTERNGRWFPQNKSGKVFGFILSSLSEKRVPQILSLFKAIMKQ